MYKEGSVYHDRFLTQPFLRYTFVPCLRQYIRYHIHFDCPF